jgi:hypothetical protein
VQGRWPAVEDEVGDEDADQAARTSRGGGEQGVCLGDPRGHGSETPADPQVFVANDGRAPARIRARRGGDATNFAVSHGAGPSPPDDFMP